MLAQGSSPGLMVDTGAVRPFIGFAFARFHVKQMEQNGFQVVWRDLLEPQYMRGVGRGSQKCTQYVRLVGALHDGSLLGYFAPVLDDDPDHPDTAQCPLCSG